MRLTKINNNQKVIGFLHYIAEGNTAYKAAEKAGFSTPRRDIARMMHSPELGQRVSEAVLHRCRTVLLPEAMAITEKLLTDKNTNARIRWDIAKILLATAGGIVAPKARDMEAAPQEISQMSGDDILRLRESLQSEMARRMDGAKLIEDYANLD